MSFLSGILDVGKSVVGFLGGNSIWSGLAKTALMGYALNRLNSNTNKGTDAGKTANIDNGVRVTEPNASTAHYIPVLYGTAWFPGKIFDVRMSADNKTMFYAIALAEKTGNTIAGTAPTYTFKDVYWNNQRVEFKTDGITVNLTRDRVGNEDRSVDGLVKIYFYAGNSTSGIIPENYTGTVPAAYTIFPNWTAGTHTLDNLIFAIVRVDYNREKNVTGLADLKWQVANSMKYPGDVLYDYMTSSRYGANILAADIDTTSLTALNTYAQESVTYTYRALNGTVTPGTVLDDRYQINGLIDTEQPVLENIEKIGNAAATWLSYDNYEGRWDVIVNKAGTSVASFSDDNILGTISVSGTGLRETYNAAKVEFPDRELRDGANFVSITLDPSLRNANEIPKTLPLAYDIINDPVQAKLLGFIELKQSRVDKVIQFQTDFSKINLQPGDIIDVTNSRLSFTSKLFRIITISEVQEDGALLCDITALEYDSSVYSTADMDKYEVSNNDEIETLGAIGVPGQPQITKVEQDARPRIVVESTSPTFGIVEAMEFWLTTDTTVPDDANRNYSLIGTVKPTTASTFGSGTTVRFEYDSMPTGNFLIKTRGVNGFVAGPYSLTAGSVFTPTQTTNAIDANTKMFNSTGGLLTGLALVQLASKLLDLFGSNSGKSIFERVFDVFKDTTGVDLVGQASGGSLVVASNIIVKNNGSNVATTVASIDFKSGLQASASGSAVIAKIKDGLKPKDILLWDGGEWVIASGCVTCSPAKVTQPDPVEPEQCYINRSATLPPSNHTLELSGCSNIIPLVPHTGSYFIRFTSSDPFYGKIEKGAGNIEMYLTDGTLHESLPVASSVIHNDTVELPFTKPRALGTDYYITMPRGAFTYCGCPSKEILPPYGDAATWDFTVAPYAVTPYLAGNFIVPGSVEYNTVRPLVTSFAVPDTSTNFALPEDGRNRFKEKYLSPAHAPSDTDESGWVCPEKYFNTYGRDQEVKIVFDEEVVKLSGTIDIINASTGAVITTKSVSSMALENEPIYDAVIKAKLGTSKQYLSDGSLNAKTSNNDKVVSVQILEGGGGYVDGTVAVSFSSPASGQKATGTAVLNSSGVVTGITITDSGWGYTSAPTVTITGDRDYSLMAADGQGKKPAKTEAFYKNRVLNIGKIKDLGLVRGQRYIVRVPAGAVMSKRVACPSDSTYEVVNRQTYWSFRISPALELVKYELCSSPNANDTTFQKVNIRSNIWMYFTKNFKIKPTGPANITIYEGGLFGGVHQVIDLRKTFVDNKVGVLSNYYLSEQTNTDTDKQDEKILKINPTRPFKPNTTYYIQVPAGVLLGADCDDPWAGISNTTTVTWKTDGITYTPPTPPSAGTPFNRQVSFDYEAPVVPGQGMATIKDASGRVVAQIDSSHPAVTYTT